jgi:hypothetical protein
MNCPADRSEHLRGFLNERIVPERHYGGEFIPGCVSPVSKDVGKGMGLGLSMTHQILQAHKPIVEVESRPAEFTRFRILFPAQRFSLEPESALDRH